MPNIRVFPTGEETTPPLAVLLEYTQGAGTAITVEAVRIDRTGGFIAKLRYQAPIAATLPAELLRDLPGGDKRLATASEMGGMFQQERADLLARLGTSFDLSVDGTAGAFFGVGEAAGAYSARLRVTPPALGTQNPDPNASVLHAECTGKFALASVWGDVQAHVELRVEVTNGDVRALLDVLSDALPELSLNLPEFALPQLKFDGLNFDCDLRFPRISGTDMGVTFAWSTRPQLAVNLAGSTLTIATLTRGTGTLSLRGQAVATWTDAEVRSGGQQLHIGGNLTAVPAKLPSAEFTVGPLLIRVLNVTATITGTPLELQLTVGRLEICAASDQSLFFALSFKVEAQAGAPLKFSGVKLLHPTAAAIQNFLAERIVEGTDAVLRLFGSIPVTGETARAVLRELARMVEVITQWLVEEGELAVKLLAGVAEGIFGVVRELISKIAELGEKLCETFAVEIRVEEQTFKLRDVILIPIEIQAGPTIPALSYAGFDLRVPFAGSPAIVLHIHPNPWAGLVYRPVDGEATDLVLATDLWLTGAETEAQRPLRILDQTSGGASEKDRLVRLRAKIGNVDDAGFVPIAINRKGIQAIQRVGSLPNKHYVIGGTPTREFVLGSLGALESVSAKTPGIHLDVSNLKDRLISLLPKVSPQGGSEFLDRLSQYVRVKAEPGKQVLNGHFEVDLKVELKLGEGAGIETQLKLQIDYHRLTGSLSADNKIVIRSAEKTINVFGLVMRVVPANPDQQTKEGDCFTLDLADESLELARDARAEITFPALSGGQGRGLVLEVQNFRVGRGGVDLDAVVTDEPVRLGGVDVPFRFTGGKLSLKNSAFASGSLTGSGNLPPELLGEASAEISLTLGLDQDKNISVQACSARLDKTGDPIVCESTKFRFTITELGLDFVREGGYHFYFMVTGTAQCLLDSGLTGSLRNIEVVLNKAPLARDGRILLRAISFLRDFKPAKRGTLFDLFEYEVRAFAFYPTSPKFAGDPPAISISGQAKFTAASDVVVPKIDFHEMLIAPPAAGSSLPRVRFDGLTLGLRLGDLAEAEGTAIAVDGSLPTLYRPDTLPANVTANGFLARGRLSIKGWASMSAAMGFLQLRDLENPNSPAKHSLFFYIQENELSEPIPTPVGEIYLREVGFGLGVGYTLAGIARAAEATSPQALVRVLDDVSRYQGSLDRFEAWNPTYQNRDLTLAMRAMFSLTTASSRTKYNRSGEKEIANPLLCDVVAALRLDGTFLMNVRAFLCVNYEDWNAAGDAAFKSNPLLRGYLYLSVPRREFLARFVSDPKGHVGEHPPLPGVIKDSLKAVSFQSALYIRPGLFHLELGWPFGLGFDLGDPNGNFHLSLRGGMVNRYEDGGVLYGIAFRASGHARIRGQIGGEALGAAAEAIARFSIEGKFLSYLSVRLASSMLYGSFQLDVSVSISISAWLQFKIFRARIRISLSFGFTLTISVALEVAILLDSGIAARVFASLGIQVFGRTLAIGIGFSINGDALSEARARVARFMALGLSVDVPSAAAIAQPPRSEPPRIMRSEVADQRVLAEAKVAPDNLPRPERNPEANPPAGVAVGPTDFWAIVLPTVRNGQPGFLLHLVPQDNRPGGSRKSEFYSPPPSTTRRQEEVTPATPFSSYPDYQVTGTGLDKLHRLTLDGKDKSLAAEKDTLRMAHEVVVHNQGNIVARFGHLLATMFLDPPADAPNEKFGEPAPLVVQLPEGLPLDPEDAAQRLHEASLQRRGLSNDEQWAMEVRESRSSLIGHAADSAVEIARIGCVNDQWKEVPKPDAPGVDARYLALTFFVASGASIDALFDPEDKPGEPRKARFSVAKRKNESNGAIEYFKPEESQVFLFNPPDRMFNQSPPTFDPVWEFIPGKGIVFNWDLEPTWGDSTGVYSDPEFHLRRYQVLREIVARDQRWVARLQFKAGAVIKNEGGELKLHRAAYQFVDNFSPENEEAGEYSDPMPDSVRNLLIHRELKAGQWEREISDGDVRVSYSITPIDVAGTRGRPESVPVTIPKPVIRLAAPVDARLSVQYQDGFEALHAEDRFTLLLHLSKQDPEKPGKAETPRTFELKVRKVETLPTGPYGSDAVSASNGVPTQDQIETAQPDDVSFELRTGDLGPGGRDVLRGAMAFDEAAAKELGISIKQVGGANGTGIKDLQTALGIPSKAGRASAVRLYLRQIQESGIPADSSAWIALPIEIRGLKRALENNLESQEHVVEAVVDEFESPREVVFQALDRGLIAVGSGRIVLAQPEVDKTLGDLLTHADQAMRPVLDAERRSGVRLTWNARPRTIQIQKPVPDNSAAAWSLIGGFDLFSYDPDAVVRPEDAEEITSLASWMGSLHLQPTSMRGISPPEFGDMSRIMAAYPSDTARTGEGGIRRRPWLSLANSVPLWPQYVRRRSVMPVVDESLVAALLANGIPETLRIVVGYSPSGSDDPLRPPTLRGEYQGIFEVLTEPLPGGKERKTRAWITSATVDGDQAVASIRRTLYNLQLSGSLTGPDEEKDDDVPFEKVDESVLRRLFVRLESMRGNRVLARRDLPFEPHADAHPLLADALDSLRYDDVLQPRYKRFEVVLDPNPSYHLQNLDTFMDGSPEGRDPYGWGALRTLGLSVGFRLYDVDTGRYLVGRDLLKRVNAAVDRAGKIYGDVFLGAPFVDLLTRPWGLAALSGHDGGLGNSLDGNHLVDNESLAVVQIALRPVAERLQNQLALRPIRFFLVTAEPGGRLQRRSDNSGAGQFIVDYVGAALSGQSIRPARLPEEPGAFAQLDPGQSFVRVVVPRGLTLAALTDIVNLTGVSKLVEVEATEVFEARAQSAPYSGLLGKFDPLAPADWRKVLFYQPSASTPENPPDPIPDPFVDFRRWATEALEQVEIPAAEERQNGLAFKFATWEERFLEHGPARKLAAKPATGFSLGTVAEQRVWRVPPDHRGNVSVFFLAPSTFGSRRRYVVRPFGRYRSFTDAFRAHEGQVPAPTLEGGLDPKDLQRSLVTIVLPRTEPLARPVILSAALLENRSLEVIIDRPIDAVLSDANRLTEAGEDFDATYLQFVREFPWSKWASKSLGKPFALEALGDLESLPPGFVDQDTMDAKGQLTQLRERAPDAWLGATVVRARWLPYFYRIHALAYTAAGAVVSEPVVATVNEGAFELKHPSRPNPGQPEVKPAVYRVARETKPGNTEGSILEQVKVTLDLPLLRFADCMEQRSRDLWIPRDGTAREHFFLPEPTVVYRVSLQARDGAAFLAESPEIDALPQPDPMDGHYVLQQLGPHLKLPVADGSPVITRSAERPGGKGEVWRLEFSAEAGSVERSVNQLALSATWIADLAGLEISAATVHLARAWFIIAPRGPATITVTRPTSEAKWGEFVTELGGLVTRYHGLPGVPSFQALLTTLATLKNDIDWNTAFPDDPDQVERTISDWWLGLPGLGAGTQFVTRAVTEPPRWPEALEGRLRWTQIEPAFASSLDPEKYQPLLTELRRYRTAADAATFARTPPYRRPLVTGEPELLEQLFESDAGISSPFDAFYSWVARIVFDGDTAALKRRLTALMQALDAHEHTGTLVELLAERRERTWTTGDVVFEGALLLPARAAHSTPVQDAARELGFGPELPGLPSHLGLWQPPVDAELGQLPEPPRTLFVRAAEAQLFGENRRLAASAAKATVADRPSAHLDLELRRNAPDVQP